MAKKLLIWTIKDIKEVIQSMTSAKNKFDAIIFIEGKRGLGKSTLGYKILNGLKIEHPFKPKRDLVYSREDTLKHLATKENGCIFSDEMVNVAFKRDFYEQGQKDLLKAFDMYRDSRNVFIGCIPIFIDLDKKMQNLCKLRFSVIRRGVALVQMQLSSIYSQDPWDIKNNQRIESRWSLKGTRNPRYSQLTTVRGILRFGDLSPRQRKEYDSIKKEKRAHVFDKYRDQSLISDPDQLFINNLMNELKQGKITPKSFDVICRINAKKPDTIRRKINNILKENNDPKRWKDYCLSDKTKKRKDKLGFSIPKPIKIEQKKEDNNILNEDIKGNEIVKIDNLEPQNKEDLFGFDS